MRRLAAFALCTVVAACAGARQGQGAPGQQLHFAVSSIRSQFGIQGRFDGTISVQDRWLYLVVPTGAVRTYQVDREDHWDLRLRAGLVSCAGRSFEVVSEGRAARLAPVLGLSQDAAFLDTTLLSFRDTLRLDVGVPPGTDLASSWIALIFEWPVQTVIATYELHTNMPLNGGAPWTGRQQDSPGERCR